MSLESLRYHVLSDKDSQTSESSLSSGETSDASFSDIQRDYMFLKCFFCNTCSSCRGKYSKLTPPYNIDCGHSICSKCKEKYSNKTFSCFKCTKESSNLVNAIPNLNLLKQVERVAKDKRVEEDIQSSIEIMLKDPFVFCIKLMQTKAEHFMVLSNRFKEMMTILREDSNKNVIFDKYTMLVRNFNDEKLKKNITYSLRQLADSIENMEQKVESTSDTAIMEERIKSVRKEFFKRFKFVEVMYEFELIRLCLKENLPVFAYKTEKGKVFYAKMEICESGLHSFAFKDKQPTYGIIFLHKKLFEGGHDIERIFFDFEGMIEGQKHKRRVHLVFGNPQNRPRFVRLFSGEDSGLCLNKLSFSKQGSSLQTPYDAKLFEIAAKYVSTEDVSNKQNTPGIVHIVKKKNHTASLQIVLNSSDEISPKLICNPIGKVVSGIHFLKRVDSAIAVDCGVQFYMPI